MVCFSFLSSLTVARNGRRLFVLTSSLDEPSGGRHVHGITIILIPKRAEVECWLKKDAVVDASEEVATQPTRRTESVST